MPLHRPTLPCGLQAPLPCSDWPVLVCPQLLFPSQPVWPRAWQREEAASGLWRLLPGCPRPWEPLGIVGVGGRLVPSGFHQHHEVQEPVLWEGRCRLSALHATSGAAKGCMCHEGGSRARAARFLGGEAARWGASHPRVQLLPGMAAGEVPLTGVGSFQAGSAAGSCSRLRKSTPSCRFCLRPPVPASGSQQPPESSPVRGSWVVLPVGSAPRGTWGRELPLGGSICDSNPRPRALPSLSAFTFLADAK